MATLKYTSVRTIGDRKVKFVWHGGNYIDVGWVGYAPVEVINVYDYEAGEVIIPRNQQGFTRAVTEWIAEYGKSDLANDLEEHYGY